MLKYAQKTFINLHKNNQGKFFTSILFPNRKIMKELEYKTT